MPFHEQQTEVGEIQKLILVVFKLYHRLERRIDDAENTDANVEK